MLTGEFLIAVLLTVVVAGLFVIRQYNKSNQRRSIERLEAFEKRLREL